MAIHPTELSPGVDRTATGPRPGRLASDRASTVNVDLLRLIVPWAVGLATLIARLSTAAVGPTDWDSAQFAEGVARFDVTHGRPQPPGYWLYVTAGRLLHISGPGTVASLVVVSAVASAVAAGLVVVAGSDLGGWWVGLTAGLVVATSPFAWFSGSIVDTYSFDLLGAGLLIILAWRARPHSWHGAAALAALGVTVGFRQSSVVSFGILALLAVCGSVRRVREAVAAVVVGAVAVAAWFVPMILSQPGGLAAWSRATRLESQGAARATSVLDHAAGGAANLGTFAAYTTVALAPLAALALLAGLVLLIRALVGRRTVAPPPDGHRDTDDVDRIVRPGAADRPVGQSWKRPWYQSRTAILAAAVVPAAAQVALVQFAKGGYLLAYLPGAVIALLLVPAAAGRPRRASGTSGRGILTGLWMWVATLAVVAIAALGTERFLAGTGVLPGKGTISTRGFWLDQIRYQAPYADTLSAIRAADTRDAGLARIGASVDPRRDVIVIDSVDGGLGFYRNAGWELPRDRIALVVPGAAIYNQLGGSLYYTRSTTVRVGPGGAAYLVALPDLPGLSTMVTTGEATPVRGAAAIGDYRLWKVEPGASVLGVRVVAVAGPRPLGSGISS
ncbi:MAG: hypothetical protein ABSB09_11160 [Acidimicrobiales bacterium]|jgi:hypothetical protein